MSRCLLQAGEVRRCLAGFAVLAAALLVLVPVSGSRGASETQVDSIRLGPLDDGHQESGTVLLKAGVRYHLVVTGYVTQAGRDPTVGSYADDAFYHFADSQHPGPPSPPGILFLGIRYKATGHVDFLRTSAEDTRDRPPYDPGHRYENHFTLKEDARLVVSASGLGDPNFTYGGPGFVVSVLSGGGSTTPPSGGCTKPTAALARATGLGLISCTVADWGQSIGFVGLKPGGIAIGVSPPLANVARAKVTLGGVSDGDIVDFARVLATERLHRGAFKAACLLVFREDVNLLVRKFSGNRTFTHSAVVLSLLDLAACLDASKVIDAIVATHTDAAAAQAPACALTPFLVAVQSSRGRPSQLRVSAGSAPNTPLHITCVRSQGQIELTVQSRVRGAPLSRFLGPRLAIGIVRSRRDPPGGQVTASFDRRP